MYRHSFSSTSSSFPGGLVHLIRPKQMFVENMLFAENPPAILPGLLDSVVFTMAPGLNPDSEIRVDFSGDAIDTFVVLLSKTQLTQPSVAEMLTNGTSIPGSLATYTFTGLDRDARYYGWVLVKATINLKVFYSDSMASTPGSLKTDPYTFINSGLLTFTRNSIATRVNSLGLIEEVPINTARLDHDPITLSPKGLLVEEARTNAITRSNDFTFWTKTRSTVTNSTDFSILTSGGVFLLAGDGTSFFKGVARGFTSSSTTRIMSVYLRRNTNNFAQIMTTGGDTTTFANFDLLTGAVGSRGTGATASTIIPWRDGWYRCTLTTSVSAATAMNVLLVSSATAPRAEINTLGTSIYIAGAQLEEGTFATSYIPTAAAAVTRAGDFASITGPNFSSWYNPIEGTFGVEFQTIFTTDSIIRYIITGNQNQLMYLAANNGTIASFDGQTPTLFGSVNASGMLAKAYLGYSATGRSLTARGANATFSSTARNFATMTSLQIGHLDTQLVPFCGWIKSLVYYPTRLSAAEIKSLSA